MAILRRLVDPGAIGSVTTHDLALTSVADGLGPAGANVHFDGGLIKGDAAQIVAGSICRPRG